MALSQVIARNSRRFRDDRQLSIGELARRAGLAKQTIVNLEGGVGNPTIETLEALASVFEVSPRALLTELGTEILVNSGDAVQWRADAGMLVRYLDQAFGSGYVFNTVLKLEANRGPARHKAGGRGALRHCYVLEGRARLGPESAPVTVKAGDFARFPADTGHLFEALTPVALVFVCTTAPQISMAGGATLF